MRKAGSDLSDGLESRLSSKEKNEYGSFRSSGVESLSGNLASFSKSQAHLKRSQSLEPKTIADFLIGENIGEGTFARVYVCRLKGTKLDLALKVMEKRFIIKEKKVELVNKERKILTTMHHPNIISLHYSFHDKQYLYMVTDLCAAGELKKLVEHYLIEAEKKGELSRACPPERCRFHFAEILSAVQYLHERGIIHRDLKPENVLLNREGRIKLIDFGTVKDENTSSASNRDFVGSRDYVSPEMLNEETVSVGADLWALGCLLFYMLVGFPPFRDENEYLTFKRITSKCDDDRISIPSAGDLDETLHNAEDLINQLTRADPKKRIGSANNCTPRNMEAYEEVTNGPQKIREHPFFNKLDLNHLQIQSPPPLPYLVKVTEPIFDGGSKDWMLQGEALELQLETDGAKLETLGDFGVFMASDEKLVLEGRVIKRNGLFAYTRHLLLISSENAAKLIYIEPGKLKLKGEIAVDSSLNVNVKANGKNFEVSNPRRTYYFTDLIGNANRWKEAIENEKQRLGS